MEPNKNQEIADESIGALADGELDAAAAVALRAALRADTAAAKTFRAYRAINEGLHALYDSVLDEPLPRSIARLFVQSPSSAF